LYQRAFHHDDDVGIGKEQELLFSLGVVKVDTEDVAGSCVTKSQTIKIHEKRFCK